MQNTNVSQPDPPAGQDIYHHQPLDYSDDQIRLIRISSVHPTLHCALSHVSFHTKPKFKALSYTWGDETPLHTIYIEGKKFDIRTNLFQFLTTVKDDTDSSYWIDQICIDQSNIQERNHQVNMMDSIYHGAEEVVCWLGPSSVQKDHFRRLNNSHLQKISRMPYWSRVWSLQEVMLARKLTFMYGEARCGLTTLADAFRVPDSLKAKPGEDRDEDSEEDSEEDYEKGYGPSPARAIINEKTAEIAIGRRLSYVVETFASSGCHKPQDKVYGLLGLVPKENRVDIDYAKSMEEIFFDVLRQVIKDENYLALSSQHDFARQLLQILNLGHLSLSEVEAWVSEEYEKGKVKTKKTLSGESPPQKSRKSNLKNHWTTSSGRMDSMRYQRRL